MKINRDSKLLLKILSAVAAVILWFAITYTEDPVISHYLGDIDIVFEGEDVLNERGIVVTNKDSMPPISAVIRGKRSSVISSIGSVSASAKVSGITEAGETEIELEYLYPTSSVTLASGKTKKITVKTEKIISRKIPIRIETVNDDKNTEYIVCAESGEKIVTVKGAESDVSGISEAKVTVDTASISKTHRQSYLYKFYDDDGDEVSEENITNKSLAAVLVENKVYKKVALPVKLVLNESLAADYVLNVKNQNVTSVSAGVDDGVEITGLTAVYNNEKPDEKNLCKLSIEVPEGVYLPKKSSEVTAECSLVPKVLKEIEIAVEAENVPEGKTVKIVPEKIKVTAKGAEEAITSDKLKARINAENLTEYTETDVEVEFETQENIQTVGSYSVTAILE